MTASAGSSSRSACVPAVTGHGLHCDARSGEELTDLGGVLNLVHASLKHLQSGASIIVIGSNAAFMSSMNTTGIDGGPGGSGYAFAKIAAGQKASLGVDRNRLRIGKPDQSGVRAG